jgi:hypothetical protein
MGSIVNIIINSVLSEYFECCRGVRQGDPLSLYLFILAVEILHKLLSSAILSNHIRGLGPILPSGHKILNL